MVHGKQKRILHVNMSLYKEKRSLITVEFCKVPAHSGIEYNEMADKLAKILF